MTLEELNEAFEKEFFQQDHCSGLDENKAMTEEDGQNNGTINGTATVHKALSQNLLDKKQQYLESPGTAVHSERIIEETDDLASHFGEDEDKGEQQDRSHAAPQGQSAPCNYSLDTSSSDFEKERGMTLQRWGNMAKDEVRSRIMVQTEKGSQTYPPSLLSKVQYSNTRIGRVGEAKLSPPKVSSCETAIARGIRTCGLTFPQLPQPSISSQPLPIPSCQQSVELYMPSQSQQSLYQPSPPLLTTALPQPRPRKHAVKRKAAARTASVLTPTPAAIPSPQQLP